MTAQHQLDGLNSHLQRGAQRLRITTASLSAALLLAFEATAATGGFLPTGSMSIPRSGHTATLLANGKVLIVGKASVNGDPPTSSAELYDPTIGTFSATGSTQFPRQRHAAVSLADGRVLIVGGLAGCCSGLTVAEIYDPATGTFSASGSMSIFRADPTATLLPNGKVLITGGATSGAIYSSGAILASAELFDPATGTFTMTGSMSVTRFGHTATLLANGQVLIAGGWGGPSHDPLASAELYDPNAGNFTPAGSMNTAHVWHTATLLVNGKVLVPDDVIELYDPDTGTFSLTGSMGIPRVRGKATPLPNGTVLVTGGFAGDDQCDCQFAEGEIYDPATGTFSCAGGMAYGRVSHTATLLPSGEVLIAGGSSGCGEMLADAEVWGAAIISPPRITGLDPRSVVQNGPAFILTVGGWSFGSGATVQWNGESRPTTVINDWQLTAAISAADLASTADFFTTATVTVVNPDGPVSNPITFTIWNNNIVAAQTVSIGPGQGGIYLNDGNEHGFTGSVNNQGSAPLAVTLAIYRQNPTTRPMRDFGGGYSLLRIPDASVSDSANVVFDFPANRMRLYLAHPALTLLYFNGTFWSPVLSSGGVAPMLSYDTGDQDPSGWLEMGLDGNASGNFTVLFDNTSTPKITELGNTVNNTVFSVGIDPNLNYQNFANGAVGAGSSNGGDFWLDNFQVGAPGTPPQLIGTVDYSDTFTLTSIRTDGLYNDNSKGAYGVENSYGNPPATWTPATDIFSFQTPGSSSDPATVGTAVGNTGASSGLAQAGAVDFNFAYGLRSDYVVQLDAIIPIPSDGYEELYISSVAAAGDSPKWWMGYSANRLSVVFRRDSGVGNPWWYFPATGVPGISILSGGWDTGVFDSSGGMIYTGVDDNNWHNYAVEFDQDHNLLTIYVDRTLKATVDLMTLGIPRITCPADIVVTAAPGQSSAVVDFNVTATDQLDDATVACNPPSGSAFPVGTTTVNCVATDPFGHQASSSFHVTVNPPPPTVSSLSPNTATAGGSAFMLTVDGSDFIDGATVLWNGAARPTTFVSPNTLTAAISASDVTGGSSITTLLVTVRNPNGAVSNPESFAITPANVGAVQTTAAEAGQTVTVSTAPTSSGQVGVTASIDNTGGDPVSLTVANYTSSPPSGTAFSAGGGFTDVQITGADAADTATVNFYYPSTIDAATEVALTLVYYNGSGWMPVRSSGNTDPAKDTTDNLGGTISGGRFTVVFSNTSTPLITQLGGTFFGAANLAPTITSLNTPANPTQVQSSVPVSMTYSAAGEPSTHRVTIAWNDGNSSVITPAISGIVNASHAYTAAGVYTLTVTLSDGVHPPVQAVSQYVVVYDPNGGFVTGGGWINSAAGAYAANPSLTGQANFGFVSKYQKGATVPTGQTQFQFQVANLNFQSTAYQWLVISGGFKAQYKGSGTINGAGNYGFILTAIDGELKGGGGSDKFRIKIWDNATGKAVYDNQLGATDSADPTTVIAGGSIVIHSS
jgi:HYR domain/Galactose oxidase, central domain